MKYPLVIFSMFLSVWAFTAPWELEKDKDGISIYTRKSEFSDFKAYKGVVSINSYRKPIVEMVLNIADYVNWFPDCKSSELLKKVDDFTFIVYYVIDSPWPASDRDAVVEMKLERDDENDITTIWFKDKTHFKAEVEGNVRVQNTSGYWKFIQSNGNTKVIYQCLTDPGGNIPSWIANLFIVDAPFKTLSVLRSKLE